MLDLIEHLHHICSSKNLKIAAEKSFYNLLTVNVRGHEIDNSTIKLISSKVDGIHKLKTPTSKTELMRFIGSMKFYSKFINKLHISLNPFFTLLHGDNSFEWTPELDNFFTFKRCRTLNSYDRSSIFYYCWRLLNWFRCNTISTKHR